MHWILEAVLHGTILGIIAFFVLFAASKAEGFTALLGRLLGYWVLLLAVLGVVCAVYGGITGKPVMPMDGMHGGPGWMHHFGPPPPPPGAGPATPAPDQKKP